MRISDWSSDVCSSDLMLIGERFGKHMVAEPFFSTVILGAGLIGAAGSDAQKNDWLPAIAEGKAKWAFAHAEHGSRFVLNEVRTNAEKSGGNWVLSGKKIVVWDAPSADPLLVLERSAGAAARSGERRVGKKGD